MKNSIILVILLALAVFLAVGDAGFASEGKKVQPVKTEATAVKPEKAPPASQAPAEPATGEQINWQVISSGGTKGSSTSYRLNGTLGQTAVGYGSSASYGLSHGFWQEFGAVTCCNHDGLRGDYNSDNAINVADLTAMVDYLFFSGPPPACVDDPGPPPVYPEGDYNGDGALNVADLTALVDFLFFSGPAPAPCP